MALIFLTGERKKIGRNSFLVFCFIPMFLISALRYNIGVDYPTYIKAFKIASEITISLNNLFDWLQPGFVVLCKVVSFFFGQNFIILFAIIAFFTLFFWFKAISQNSPDPFLSIYILICSCIYYQSFNQMRQMLAVAILTYSVRFILKRDILRFFICIAIATSFHFSAVVFIFAYFISELELNKKTLLLYIIFAFVGIKAFDLIVTAVTNYTPYGFYFGSHWDTQMELNTIVNLVYRIGWIIVLLFFYKILQRESPRVKVFYNLCLLGVLLQVFAVQSAIFARLPIYYWIFIIFLIPKAVYSINNNFTRNIVYIGIVVFFTALHIVYFTSDFGSAAIAGYKIYHSIFSM